MNEKMELPVIPIPAGEAREDEREIEKVADRVQDQEPAPSIRRDAAVVPLAAPAEDGKSVGLLGPDGNPVAMRGEVVTTMSAVETQHELLRKVKPCISCGHAYFPRQGSREAAEIAAFVSDGLRWGYMRPGESTAEYMCCRTWNKCVHVSQHCMAEWGPDRHVFGRGWLGRMKAWVARMGVRLHGGRR